MLEVLEVNCLAFLARKLRPAAAKEKIIVIAAYSVGNGKEYALEVANDDLAKVSLQTMEEEQ